MTGIRGQQKLLPSSRGANVQQHLLQHDIANVSKIGKQMRTAAMTAACQVSKRTKHSRKRRWEEIDVYQHDLCMCGTAYPKLFQRRGVNSSVVYHPFVRAFPSCPITSARAIFSPNQMAQSSQSMSSPSSKPLISLFIAALSSDNEWSSS